MLIRNTAGKLPELTHRFTSYRYRKQKLDLTKRTKRKNKRAEKKMKNNDIFFARSRSEKNIGGNFSTKPVFKGGGGGAERKKKYTKLSTFLAWTATNIIL
jgi:hypothetical protein